MLSRQVVLFWGFVGLIPACSTHEIPVPSRNHTRVGSLGAAVVAATFLGVVLWRGGGIDCPRNVVSAAFTVGFYPREVPSSELPLVVEGDAPGEELRLRTESSEGWRWMREAGDLTLCNGTGQPVIVDLAVDIASFNEVRRVEIHERGTRLMTVDVPTRAERLELRGIEVGREGAHLILVPFPGPARPDEILRNGDQRSVSVRLGDPILVTAPPLSL